jgi:phthiodiolone/phenolphthiodiolone dimycocerosates ketoreductase
MAVAGAVAVLTKNVKFVTGVVDTIRRHPSMLAQTALTLSHLSKGRFMLGVGSGEAENTEPYGFSFSKHVSRFEEALKVIRLLWDTDGPVDFEGQFYKLHHARLDTEPYEGKFPPIWIAANGPRMLDIAGRYADGWLPGPWSPEEYAEKWAILRTSAERAGRDPGAITPAHLQVCIIAYDDAELAEIMSSPMVKYFVMNISGADFARRGLTHPMGNDWGGSAVLDPGKLSREFLIKTLAKVTPDMLKAFIPTGSPQQVARKVKGFIDAGARIFKILDYGGMGGLKFGAKSAQKVRETEDELLRLVAGG